MFTKKEIGWSLISFLIFSFVIGFVGNFTPSAIIVAFLIISISLVMKKLSAKYFYVDIEHDVWKFQRYGFLERSKFKKPFPIGLVLPFFMTILSLGLIKPLMFLQFKSKSSKLRILKNRGIIHRTLEVKESDLAFISAAGFWGLLLLSLIGLFTNFELLTQYSIYYGLWNLIPISNLDGAKLFFGSFFNWVLLTIIYLISLVIILL